MGANVVIEASSLCIRFLKISCSLSHATVGFCDNVSAMYLASNPGHLQKIKHVEINSHFVREFRCHWSCIYFAC